MTRLHLRRRPIGIVGWLLLFAAVGNGVHPLAWAGAANSTVAQRHDKPRSEPHQKPNRLPSGPWQRSLPAFHRAGNPQHVSWFAQPSRNKHDMVGYVGGGTAWKGEPRCDDEGTFGLDYGGLFAKRHIWLKWLHGRPSHQPGGSYEPDGPHLLSH